MSPEGEADSGDLGHLVDWKEALGQALHTLGLQALPSGWLFVSPTGKAEFPFWALTSTYSLTSFRDKRVLVESQAAAQP